MIILLSLSTIIYFQSMCHNNNLEKKERCNSSWKKVNESSNAMDPSLLYHREAPTILNEIIKKDRGIYILYIII